MTPKLAVLAVVLSMSFLSPTNLAASDPDWSAVFEKVAPSVVKIQHVRNDAKDYITHCSGVVIALIPEPLILTAKHCIVMPEEYQAEITNIFYADQVPLEQVAELGEYVLMVTTDSTWVPSWTPIQVRKAPLVIGEPVAAIGHGFGSDHLMITAGIISGFDLIPGDPELGTNGTYMDLQAIGGQSGGAIVDANGELVSIMWMFISDGFMSPTGLTYVPGLEDLHTILHDNTQVEAVQPTRAKQPTMQLVKPWLR